MSHADITFYFGTLLSAVALFSLLYKATIGARLKELEAQMVTKEDLLNELIELREWLRREFVAKK